MSSQALLEAIAALSDDERRELFTRLRDIYGVEAAPMPPVPRRTADLWSGPSDYLIVFDGGSHGNPGPGYGSYIIFDSVGSGQIVRLDFKRDLTNNEAEYHTLLAALGELAQRVGKAAANTAIKVLGDSALVIAQVTGKWETREPRLRELRDQVRAELKRFKQYRLAHQPRDDVAQILGH
jgi:ribonuclease HI